MIKFTRAITGGGSLVDITVCASGHHRSSAVAAATCKTSVAVILLSISHPCQ